ncbi:MAG: head decoration protein [Arthrobacter sp.]|jgi:hypothetical protein|nr:head decoration protein [Arthrobacter sp.]
MDISIKRRNYPADNQSWLGSATGTTSAQSVALDLSTFTKATHFPDGYLKSGLPLSKRAGGKYGLAETEKLDGFLFTPTDVPADTATPVGAALLVHGIVRTAKLPVAITAEQKAANAHFIYNEEA